MSIKFLYSGKIYSKERELVASNLFTITKTIIDLPDDIEIEFKDLGPGVYAETVLDSRFKNRIRINDWLTHKEIIRPMIHELLHLNQMFKGRLSMKSNNVFIWDKKPYIIKYGITVDEWAALPWEVDVSRKQNALLDKVLRIGVDIK